VGQAAAPLGGRAAACLRTRLRASTSKPAHVEFRHATVVDDVNILVSHDVGWTAEQLAHVTVGIGLRLFPRVEPPTRWQRWSVEPNRDRRGVRSCRADGHG
jgi:hypothetical protein